MIRFPYTLQRWNSATEEWQTVSRCNARYDGKTRFIESPNGKAIEYTYEVIMPANVRPIEENEEVRILDRHGKNIFDRRPDTPVGSTLEDSVSYPVQGYFKSGQRYEYTKLWL